MKRIESASNPRIKALLRELRKGSESWIVEGRTLFLDAVLSGISFREIYGTAAMLRDLQSILLRVRDATVIVEVSHDVMKLLSTLDTPPGIIGVVTPSKTPAPEAIHRFAAMLFSVRDPGNLGTLIRSAEAAGCEFVVCSSDCADPHHPRVIRASMGSIFRVPVFKISNDVAFAAEFRSRGVSVFKLAPREGKSLFEFTPRHPALIVIGGETSGIPRELECDAEITIPMKGRVESLNVAMAGTLCFYRFMERS
jgi:TrmH family RNA methyltransferase